MDFKIFVASICVRESLSIKMLNGLTFSELYLLILNAFRPETLK